MTNFSGPGLPGGLPPPRPPRGGRAGDGNNNAGAAFGGAPAALRAAGVVAPIHAHPRGVWGAGAPQEGQFPRNFCYGPMLVANF